MYRTIALITEDRYVDQPLTESNWYLRNIFDEDRLLADALAQRGFASQRVSWSDSRVNWASYDRAVVRTTWDYFERFPAFSQWLEDRRRDCRLINTHDLLRWNLDKHYLADLSHRGVDVVPTHFLERGQPVDLDALLGRLGAEEAVLKPCVSGAARNTFRIRTEDRARWQSLLEEHLPQEAMMVQPFQRSIVSEGELTLIAMGGVITHAVRKVVKAGDFRVQDDHGGSVHRHNATAEETAFAQKVMAACPSKPVYARVDLVRGNDGRLCVMELELIEPELWMRFHSPSASAFAEAIVGEI